MDRETMARALFDATEAESARQGYATVKWEQVDFANRAIIFACTDAAIALCAKAAEDGYKEAWFDGACTSGCECAVCMMDSDTAWDDSDTRKQWSKP